MKKGFFYFVFLVFFLGCTTVSKDGLPPREDFLPPEVSRWPINQRLLAERDLEGLDLALRNVSEQYNKKESVQWWVAYRRAQLWSHKKPHLSCSLFQRLSKEPQFPLNKVAQLRAYEVCVPSESSESRWGYQNLKLEDIQLDELPRWIRELALDAALKQARTQNSLKDIMDLSHEKSKLFLPKEQKIELTEEALRMAEKLNDKEMIESMNARLFMLSPSRNPHPRRNELLAVAADHRHFRNFEESKKVYRQIIKDRRSSFSEKLSAYRGLRTTYRVAQERPDAVIVAGETFRFIEDYFNGSRKTEADGKLLVDFGLIYARDLWTQGQRTQADKVLDQLISKAQGISSLDSVYWIKGRMAEEVREFSAAIDWYRKALEEPRLTGSDRDRLYWSLAWNLRKKHRHEEAIEVFESFIEDTQSSSEAIRARYWLGRSLVEAGKKKEGHKHFKKQVEDDALNYYGLLALRELGKSIPARTIRPFEAKPITSLRQTPKELREHADVLFLEWLVSVQEKDVAQKYLDSVFQDMKKAHVHDKETWVGLFSYYSRAEHYLPLFFRIGEIDPEIRQAIHEAHPGLVFPRPFYETVSSSARKYGVGSEFIYAIMRQESAFNPRARSHMDAFGLMQLIPQVAEQSAKDHNLNYAEPEDLYRPEINIPLGAAHLKELWDRHQGDLILAAASYNASERAIQGWLRTRFLGDPTEFIEDIPYNETRDYVKLVLRNFITYKALGSSRRRLDFPEWALRVNSGETHLSGL